MNPMLSNAYQKQTIMRRLLFGCLFIIGTIGASAQKNITLKIDHFLGSNVFAVNSTGTNNLGHSFKANRLEYYISEITLVHDGGQEQLVSGKYILANASSSINESLGSFSITNLEGIKLSVGVDSATNHLDPASYNMSHPLAPKSPSMHWGWISGYRFVAMEGMSGSSLNQPYEIHALGDNNYHTFTINTAGVVNGNDIDIELQADYEKALYDIDISSGLVSHGESGASADLLVNFSQRVFTANGSPSISVEENVDSYKWDVFPNPAANTFNISLSEIGNDTEIVINDITGRTIQTLEINQNNSSITIEESGVYILSILNEGNLLGYKRIVIL